MAATFQTPFSNTFSWMKMLEFQLKFHWNLFPRVQLTIIQHCFRYWLGTYKATSHYLSQWWPSVLTHMCCSASVSWLIKTYNTKPQWCVNIGSGNGLVSSGTKPLPEPMLNQIYAAIWHHLAPNWVESWQETHHSSNHIDLCCVCCEYLEKLIVIKGVHLYYGML